MGSYELRSEGVIWRDRWLAPEMKGEWQRKKIDEFYN